MSVNFRINTSKGDRTTVICGYFRRYDQEDSIAGIEKVVI